MKKINVKELLTRFKNARLNPQGVLIKIIQNRNKLILTIIVIVAVLYLYFSFGLRSQMRAVRAINPKIERLREDLKNIKLDLIEMQAKQPQNGFMETEVKTLASPDRLSWLIEEISHLANQQDVRIYNIKPGRIPSTVVSKKHSQELYPSVIFDLEISAGYFQLSRFLAELEGHPVLLEIEELDIRGNDRDPFAHKINLKLKTYCSL